MFHNDSSMEAGSGPHNVSAGARSLFVDEATFALTRNVMGPMNGSMRDRIRERQKGSFLTENRTPISTVL